MDNDTFFTLSKFCKKVNLKKTLFLLFILLPGYFFSSAQTLAQNIKTTLSQYRTVQFISSTGLDPKRVMFMDNNDKILLASVNGVTREGLTKQGIEFKESQIALMKLIRLLVENKKELKTAIPLIDSVKTFELRKRSKTISDKLFPQIKPAIIQLVNQLKNLGCENNSYSILFSYVLDGLAWDEFAKLHLIDDIEITADTPFWDGEVWSYYPKRNFSCGTNTRFRNGIAIKLNWSSYASDTIRTFWGDRNNVMQMLEDIAETGKVENKQVINTFARFGLFDKNGVLTIPVIEENNRNSLYTSCTNIAEKIAAKVNNELDAASQVKYFGFRDEKQALIITYHEIIWDLMGKFEMEKIIKKPAVLASTQNSNAADISNLVFIVH